MSAIKFDSEMQIPIIFLVGPPGAGKSQLGEKACKEIELQFLDLSTPAINEQSLQLQRATLKEVINKRSAEIIALPWSLQQDKGIRTLIRRSGVLLLLWAHPLDMQARSSHTESLFTPSPRIKTKGGFGRNGTGCCEFRSLDRVADEVLLLINNTFDEAANDLQDYIVSIREESLESPIVRAGLEKWVDDWHEDYDISKNIATIIVDAMARYILFLRSEGKSSRTLSGVYSDLQAAGMLVIGYDYPKGQNAAKILKLFSSPPWTIEFKRKFSGSPNAIARYKRNLKDFAHFLINL
jgi:frataxin-like iron-binding protein CyaY